MSLLLVVVVLQLVLLVAVVLMLLRRPAAAVDPRTAARTADLSSQLTRLDARSEAQESALRSGLAGIRQESGESASANRDAAARDFSALRTEITSSIATLGETLRSALADFRADNNANAAALAKNVQLQLETIGERLGSFISEANRSQIEARESVNAKLSELTAANGANLERVRLTIEERLDRLNVNNAAKLEEMRVTVDEKLHATLHTRLTESFGQVTDQLNKVHTGLGEMTKLSEGVDGLSRIFTNVKSRGGFAEVQLGMLLEQMLAPSQFVRNARVKTGSLEVVEFAVRFPGHDGDTLLPIDAKFPREDWERLETAYESGTSEERLSAGRAFEAAIRTEAKRICEKYIQPPVTTPHAIMFLPTEGLYAEVMRREGLQAEVQSKCKVTIAGPTSLSAILTSFQMGFALIAFQKKGDEVWKVLGSTKNEFDKFTSLMGKMEKQVGTVQNTIQDLNTRTRAISRTLRDVTTETIVPAPLLEFDGIAPLLAAVALED